jgi:hypothetical protein
MRLEYRGHCICLVEAPIWSAEVIESISGVQLPTKLVAEPHESAADLARRARRLVDLYIGDESSGAPAREAGARLRLIRS